jgi:hypothetical protein
MLWLSGLLDFPAITFHSLQIRVILHEIRHETLTQIQRNGTLLDTHVSQSP